jgi:hypothetical protein
VSAEPFKVEKLDVDGGTQETASNLRPHGANPYPAPTALTIGKTKAQTLTAVAGTGFIVG